MNTKLYELSKDLNNVSFIDRNAPFSSKEGYLMLKDNKGIFEDQLHYSAFGGSIVAKYIFDNIK